MAFKKKIERKTNKTLSHAREKKNTFHFVKRKILYQQTSHSFLYIPFFVCVANPFLHFFFKPFSFFYSAFCASLFTNFLFKIPVPAILFLLYILYSKNKNIIIIFHLSLYLYTRVI